MSTHPITIRPRIAANRQRFLESVEPVRADRPATMTSSDVALALGVDRSTARRRMNSGEIPGVFHSGSRALIRREAFERWERGESPQADISERVERLEIVVHALFAARQAGLEQEMARLKGGPMT